MKLSLPSLKSARAYSWLVLLALSASALANAGNIRLTTFPNQLVADGRSTVTISAEVRTNGGEIVPDGTQVVFQTTLGTLKETTVATSGGAARATLIAGSLAGQAKVTATALRYNASNSISVELVRTPADLRKGQYYIEISAPTEMQFSLDNGIVAASGLDGGAKLKYQNIEIKADDMQFEIVAQRVKARNATLKIGKDERKFSSLQYSLISKTGRGVTEIETEVAVGLRGMGRYFYFATEKQLRSGLVDIQSDGEIRAAPRGLSPGRIFAFEDIAFASTLVHTSKLVLVPGKELQLHKATIYVEGQKALSLPLYQVSLDGSQPSSIAEQIFTFNDSRLGIDYAHHLTLEPSSSSLVRFRTGQRYGRSFTGSGGAFLDYEWKWNRGPEMEGGLVVSGLARSDWTVDLSQNYRYSDNSTLSALISSPAHKTLFGSLNFAKPIGDYYFNMSAMGNKSLRGPDVESRQISAVVESRGIRPGDLPLNLYYGVTATDGSLKTSNFSRDTQNMGLRMRGHFDQFRFGRATSIDSGFTVSHLWGDGVEGLSWQGNANLRTRLGNSTELAVGYDIVGGDALDLLLTGRQRINLQASYFHGSTNISLLGAKSLDADWSTFYIDTSYKLGGPFRFSTSYTLDQYLDATYLDYDYTLWYQLGVRDIGLTWSKRTGRLGLQFLGARF